MSSCFMPGSSARTMYLSGLLLDVDRGLPGGWPSDAEGAAEEVLQQAVHSLRTVNTSRAGLQRTSAMLVSSSFVVVLANASPMRFARSTSCQGTAVPSGSHTLKLIVIDYLGTNNPIRRLPFQNESNDLIMKPIHMIHNGTATVRYSLILRHKVEREIPRAWPSLVVFPAKWDERAADVLRLELGQAHRLRVGKGLAFLEQPDPALAKGRGKVEER